MIYRFLLVPLRISWDPPMEGIEWTCMICRVLDCAYAHRCCLIDSEPDLLICWHVLTHVFLKKSGWAQKRCLFWCAKRIINIYIYTYTTQLHGDYILQGSIKPIRISWFMSGFGCHCSDEHILDPTPNQDALSPTGSLQTKQLLFSHWHPG